MTKKDLKRKRFLTESELASYWDVSVKTLQRWRTQGTGPIYTKLGGKTKYSKRAIFEYERQRRFISSSERYEENGGRR
ncbi:MAG: helix-turn-helix domain-containing protein [Alphaproteobacteria bacterium]|nr:helix-turn-helix domain-containing protein [Alphaproteobacteria bacterium]